MLVVYNAVLVNSGVTAPGYVIVEGSRFAEVSFGEPDADLLSRSDHAIDAGGAYLLPGVIDTHVHLREPGMTAKADIASESRAIAAGGVTSWIDMPNVLPPTVTLEALDDKQRRAEAGSINNYAFYIGATAENIDILAHEVDYSRVAGVKAFLGSSTGGLLLNDGAALERLFAEVKTLIAVHCEHEATIAADSRRLREQYGDDVPVTCHPQWRSAQACFRSASIAVDLARRYRTRLHVLHVSTTNELNLFTTEPHLAKHITAEACVGHLLFTDADYPRLGNRIKVNPSIKTDADRRALRAALTDRRIDTIATDHAPHTLDEKSHRYIDAPSGMPMAQFALPAMLDLAREQGLLLSDIVNKMCHAPAEIFNIDRRGFLQRGYYADFVLVEEVPEGYTISDADVLSRCGWTPLNGTTLHHRVTTTVVNGTIVYDRNAGGLIPPHAPRPAMPLHFNR